MTFMTAWAATASAETAPAEVVTGADEVITLPFDGLYSRPVWDERADRLSNRVALDATEPGGATAGRVVILEDLSIAEGRVRVGRTRVIPSDGALQRESLDPGSVDVGQLAWDPLRVCDFTVRSNGVPISAGGLPPWFGVGPKRLYTDRWDPITGSLSGRADFHWVAFSPEGALICSIREDSRSATDLYALHRPGRFVPLTQTPGLAEMLPTVASDGRMVAFASQAQDEEPQLAIARLTTDAEGLPQLAGDPIRIGSASGAAWCPLSMGPAFGDARLLAYYGERRGRQPDERPIYDLYLAQIPLTGPIRLSRARKKICEDVILNTDVVGVNPPSWTSDGRHLFFIRYDGATNPVAMVEVAQEDFFQQPAPYHAWDLDTDTILNMFVSVSPDNTMLAIVSASSRAVEVRGQGTQPHWPYLLALRWNEP